MAYWAFFLAILALLAAIFLMIKNACNGYLWVHGSCEFAPFRLVNTVYLKIYNLIQGQLALYFILERKKISV